MLAEKAYLSGALSGVVIGAVFGMALVTILGYAAMVGDDPSIVSIHGEKGKPRVVEVGGTVYCLVSEARYSELRRYEWAAKNGR